MPWVAFGSFLAVAVGAPNFAFGYFQYNFFDALPTKAARYVKAFCSDLREMVKLKNDRICFTAINAWVFSEIIYYEHAPAKPILFAIVGVILFVRFCLDIPTLPARATPNSSSSCRKTFFWFFNFAL
jgi:hypothetical protein